MNKELYFAAMWLSCTWLDYAERYRDGLGVKRNMRMANYSRARGIVLHDRILNNEIRRAERNPHDAFRPRPRQA